jgi:hypothetical protein
MATKADCIAAAMKGGLNRRSLSHRLLFAESHVQKKPYEDKRASRAQESISIRIQSIREKIVLDYERDRR